MTDRRPETEREALARHEAVLAALAEDRVQEHREHEIAATVRGQISERVRALEVKQEHAGETLKEIKKSLESLRARSTISLLSQAVLLISLLIGLQGLDLI